MVVLDLTPTLKLVTLAYAHPQVILRVAMMAASKIRCFCVFTCAILSVFSAGCSAESACSLKPGQIIRLPSEAQHVQSQDTKGLFGSEHMLSFRINRKYMDQSIVDNIVGQLQAAGLKQCVSSGWRQFIDAVSDEPVKTASFNQSFVSDSCYAEILVQQPKPLEDYSNAISTQTVVFLINEDTGRCDQR